MVKSSNSCGYLDEDFHQGKCNPVGFVGLFGLVHNVPVSSYGHVGKVSSPNHTFFLGKLD